MKKHIRSYSLVMAMVMILSLTITSASGNQQSFYYDDYYAEPEGWFALDDSPENQATWEEGERQLYQAYLVYRKAVGKGDPYAYLDYMEPLERGEDLNDPIFQAYKAYKKAYKVYLDAKTTVPTAYASMQTVQIDGKSVLFYAYALKDENGFDTNYVKLRDVAQALNGTTAQFEVGWDGSITITTGTAYTPNGSEMVQNFYGNQPYTVNTAPVKVNGKAADLEAITLTDAEGGGFTYFKLRDLGTALGFAVDWTAEKGIFIETPAPQPPAVRLYKDGTYTGTGFGFRGDVTATITVTNGVITSLTLSAPDETPTIGGAALPRLEANAKAAGADMDGVSGATFTSNAAKEAVAAALAQAKI